MKKSVSRVCNTKRTLTYTNAHKDYVSKTKTTLRYDNGDVILDQLELTIEEGTLSYIGVHQQNKIRPSADQTEYGTLGLLVSKQEDGEFYVPVDMLSWQPGANRFIPVGNGTQRHDCVPGTAFFNLIQFYTFFFSVPQIKCESVTFTLRQSFTDNCMKTHTQKLHIKKNRNVQIATI